MSLGIFTGFCSVEYLPIVWHHYQTVYKANMSTWISLCPVITRSKDKYLWFLFCFVLLLFVGLRFSFYIIFFKQKVIFFSEDKIFSLVYHPLTPWHLPLTVGFARTTQTNTWKLFILSIDFHSSRTKVAEVQQASVYIHLICIWNQFRSSI